MSEVNFNYLQGNYSSYQKEEPSKKEEKQEATEAPKAKQEAPVQTDTKDFWNAMKNLGMQAYMPQTTGVDPKKYVDDASEARIIDSMKAFEQFMSYAQKEGVPQSVAERAALRYIG